MVGLGLAFNAYLLLDEETQSVQITRSLKVSEGARMGLSADEVRIFNSKRHVFNMLFQEVSSRAAEMNSPTQEQVSALWVDSADAARVSASERMIFAKVGRGLVRR